MATTMKALVYRGPENMVIEEIERPSIGRDGVLIKVKYVSICGGDLHVYRCGYGSKPGKILGHEYCGYVEEVGEDVTGLSVGDRVWGMEANVCGTCWYCQNGDYAHCSGVLEHVTGHGVPGAMAQYVKISPAVVGRTVHIIPDEITDIHAALIEPFGIGADMVDGAVKPGDNVIIVGAGMVGNAILQFAKIAEAASVTVTDVSDARLELAKQCGADYVINSAREDVLTRIQEIYGPNRWYYGESGRCDVGFETAGVGNTVNDVVGAVKAGGTVVLVAPSEREVGLNLAQLINKYQEFRLPISGSHVQDAIAALAQHRLVVDPLITNIFPFDRARDAFEAQSHPERGMKSLIQVNE